MSGPTDGRADWWGDLDENHLLRVFAESYRGPWPVGGVSIDQFGAACFIDRDRQLHAGPERYWLRLKVEIRALVCTDDPRYDDLRRRFRARIETSHMSAVALLAAALAEPFGLAAGVISPFCALALIGMLRVGRETFCASLDLDIPLPDALLGDQPGEQGQA